MDNKKATADQIENLRRQWMVLDYQSKVALAFAFNDAIERLEESMTSQRSRESPTRPVQDEKATKNKKRTKKAKTSLPTAAPQGHLDELTEVPTTKDPELQTTTQRLTDGMTSTPTKRSRTTDSGEESFRTIQSKKKKQGASPPQARKPSPESTRKTTPDQPAERRTSKDPTPGDRRPSDRQDYLPHRIKEGHQDPRKNQSDQNQSRDLPPPLQDRRRPPQGHHPWIKAYQLLREAHQEDHRAAPQHCPPGRGSKLPHPHQS